MRRNWRRLSAAILVLAAIGLGTAALFWAVTRGPFMSAVASRLLGRPVEIATISLIPARAFEIEVTGLVIRDPTTGEVQIEVPHARARQPWPWLLAGGFFPLHWEFDSPVIRLSPEQRTKPAVLNVPPVDLVVRDGTIELRVAKEIYRVHDLALDLRRSQLRPRATGRASGELRRGERALGRFDARVEGWLRDATAVVKLDAVQLESLPLDFDGDVGGVARGELRVRYEQSGIGVEVDVNVESFALRLAGMSALVAPKTTRLRGKVSWSAEGLRMEPKGLQFDDLVLTGRVTVGSGPGARVRADLTLGDFEPGRPAGQRINGIKLMAMRFESWERANQRIEAGRVEDLRVRLDLPLAGLGSALSFRRRLEPGEFEFDARVSGGVYRTSPDTPALDLGNKAVILARVEGGVVLLVPKPMRADKSRPILKLESDGKEQFFNFDPSAWQAPWIVTRLPHAKGSLEADGRLLIEW